jgi:hypothetical protein
MSADSRKTSKGLEIRTRYYTNARTGHEITIMGAIHVAHSRFWAETYAALNAAALEGEIHYESILAADPDVALSDDAQAKIDNLKKLASTSRLFADLTGLKYQGDAINFKEHTDWKNIDEDIVSISENLDANTLTKSADAIKDFTEGKTLAELVTQARGILFFLRNINTMSKVGNVIRVFKGQKKMDLLTSRNVTAISAAVAAEKNVTMFWGAAHLKGMDKLLRDAGYNLEATRWTVAIPADHEVSELNIRLAQVKWAEDARKAARAHREKVFAA